MSTFTLPSTSISSTSTPAHAQSAYSSDSEELDTLPYPGELPRNDFLAPDFDPQSYLSTLRNRHQTLEDLRTDLRQRSQLLNRELLDLVNGNYEEFLGLGSDLKGGEEKVEGVRVGLLGFQREVKTIQNSVRARAGEVGKLLQEKKVIRREAVLGRNLLEVSERLEDLEESLGIKPTAGDVGELDDEDEDEVDDASASASHRSFYLGRLRRHTQQYLSITRTIDRLGPSHPFLQAQGDRLVQVSKTILIDLATALRQAKSAQDPDAMLAVTRMYGDIGAEEESIRVLKGG